MEEKQEKEKLGAKIKRGFGKVKEKVKSLSRKTLIIIAAVVAVVVIALIALAVSLSANRKEYAVLVTGVSNNEAASVISYLEGQGVTNYKVENNDTILVPKGQEENLKAKILMENLTESGFFYSTYFDHINSLSTEAERNQVTLFDLQDRLGATIRSLEGVREAVVTITPGEDKSYILDNNVVVEAEASVTVTMADGKELGDEMANAIRHLVSHSIKGLEIGSVGIIDSLGNVYGEFGSGTGDTSQKKLELELLNENRIRTEVMKALTPFFGEDNVRVAVKCEVELGNVTEHRTDYELPEYAQDGSTGGRGIVDSEGYQYSNGRPGDDSVGGPVGADVNSDLSEYVEDNQDIQGDERSVAGGWQKDYLTSNSVKDIYNDSGHLVDVSVAVSINSKVAEGANLRQLQSHVARAANITGDIDETTGEENLDGMISIMAMDFFNPTAEPDQLPDDGSIVFLGVPLWVWIAAGVGLLLFIILLVVILLLRRRKRKMQEEEERREQEEMDALLNAAGMDEPNAESGADVMSLQTERSMELRKDIRQFVTENPEVAAQMIRSWLRGDNDDG